MFQCDECGSKMSKISVADYTHERQDVGAVVIPFPVKMICCDNEDCLAVYWEPTEIRVIENYIQNDLPVERGVKNGYN